MPPVLVLEVWTAEVCTAYQRTEGDDYIAHSKEDLGARVAFFKNVLPQLKRTGSEDVHVCREKGQQSIDKGLRNSAWPKNPGASTRGRVGRRISKWASLFKSERRLKMVSTRYSDLLLSSTYKQSQNRVTA